MRILLAAALLALSTPQVRAQPVPDNPLIDYDGFVRNVAEVRAIRERHRLSEAEFLRMAAEPGVVILDARSERLYKLRHVRGAMNLSFPEFTEQALARLVPTKDTRILIYCNNNFEGALESMPTKAISSALNVSTFVSLHAYGYRNVYELGPAVDVTTSRLLFEGAEVDRIRG
jgi:phage shock protein E